MADQFPPTPEQVVILDAFKSSDRNMLISALAGAAKTSTLVRIANASQKSMLCLAFNVRIVKEMKERLPGLCVAKTLNSVGHKAWADYLRKKFLQVNEKKTYEIVGECIGQVMDKKDQSELYKRMAQIMSSVDFGKTAGWIPDGHYPLAKRLMDDEQFFAALEDEVSGLEAEIITAATLISLHRAHEGDIDYNDQILCPTVFPASFTQYPVTLVDEAQDLSALNHAMLQKIVGKKRVIAVGDECQSIYGFRGAHQDSMQLLRDTFDMQVFGLTISFRCPVKIVEHARWRAPMMKYPEGAKEGEVKTLLEWDENSLPENAAIICRNNAPLFSVALKLLQRGRYPELVGNDLGKGLYKILKSLGKPDLKRAEVLTEIELWCAKKLETARNKEKVKDQAACLVIFAKQGHNLGEAMSYLEHVLSQAGPIKLMTGHKSKGLEFPHIFFLDQDLLGDDQQEKNLRYVIQTRAKETLTYIQSGGWIDDNEAEPGMVNTNSV